MTYICINYHRNDSSSHVPLKKPSCSEHSEEQLGYLEMSRVARHDVALDKPTTFNRTTVHKRTQRIKFKNSILLLALSRISPNITDVVITEFCFSTPRIIIHRCCASMTTATPRAPVISAIV